MFKKSLSKAASPAICDNLQFWLVLYLIDGPVHFYSFLRCEAWLSEAFKKGG